MNGTRTAALALAAALSLAGLFAPAATAADTLVDFDLPDTIECRDVTPKDYAADNPSLKVIEAKFRVSARIIEGSEKDVVDFPYVVTTPKLRLRVQDCLPNTTLESTMADDRIEVTTTNEHTDATNEDAHVAYKVLALGGTKNDTSKKSESDHYKEIVPRTLVLASGTLNREHGVFFKLSPSKTASLEGAKTFTILAVVSKQWRGDWCVITCSARAKKKSLFSTHVAGSGVEQAHVGMYILGDREARLRAEELCEIQQTNDSVLSSHLARHGDSLVESMHVATDGDQRGHSWFDSLFGWILNADHATDADEADSDREARRVEVEKEMDDIQEQLSRLAGSRI